MKIHSIFSIFVKEFEPQYMSKVFQAVIILLLINAVVFAQSNKADRMDIPADTANLEDREILLRNEMTGGALIHANGWGINIRRGKHKTAKLKRMMELDIVSMKHPKEFKSVNPYFENSKGFIYGKLNTVTLLRLGYGGQWVVVHRQDRRGGGVEIRYHLYGGASLAFVKPVYLEILVPTNVPFEFSLSTERYDPSRHYIDNIYGKAPFTKGLDQMKIYPGIYIKTGFSFEYASRLNNIKAIEAGIAIDGYYKKIPIMAFAENHPYFVSLYLGINLGSKWY